MSGNIKTLDIWAPVSLRFGSKNVQQTIIAITTIWDIPVILMMVKNHNGLVLTTASATKWSWASDSFSEPWFPNLQNGHGNSIYFLRLLWGQVR